MKLAKLSDYGVRLGALPTVTIKGIEFPVEANVTTWEHVAKVYGEDYQQFEQDLNEMHGKAKGTFDSSKLKSNDMKIMRALIYGVLATGGLEDSPEDVFRFLGMERDIIPVYAKCMEVYAPAQFQVEDLKKSKKPQDYQAQKKGSKKGKNRKKK